MNQLPFESKKRKLFVKKESETDPNLGCIPEKRKVEELLNYGVVNIDKPKGPTSHQISAFVQKILNIKKSGHSGTLDPAVTGVLPVALGRATRIVTNLLKAGKEYIAIMHLHKDIDEKTIRETINSFIGKIEQMPPIKSSVKRQLRFRNVYYIEILEIDGKDVLFRVGCEAGTYIRKICHDLGQKLGTGAHMAELRRTKAGPFDESTLVTLQDLTDAYWYWKNNKDEKPIRHCIQPMETAVSHLPKIWVLDSAIESITHGTDLKIPGISKLNDFEKDETIAIMSLKNELVATGKALMNSDTAMKEEKGIVVKADTVFMLPGTYKV
jgi:H/ACA ribonucleoprotein complex subunit 4